MIELPPWAVPNGAEPAFVDAGGVMRSPLGTAALRVDRPGSHYKVALSFPPYQDRQASILISRLVRAQREGLRVEYPLAEPQPVFGAPVVDGADQAGSSLSLRGLQSGTAIREGWWLSIVQTGGQRYLHNVAASAIVDAEGKVALALSEMLRDSFPDGASVEIARPMIEGLTEGAGWSLDDEGKAVLITSIEEAA